MGPAELMQKPDSLRAAITAVLPDDFGRDPDRLKIWIDEGRIRAPMTANRAFAWSYKLNVVLIEFKDHPSIVFLAINDWLRVNQPDLLSADPAAGYTFTADIMDSETVDLQIELDLTEQVVLVARDDGGSDLQHLPEPDPLFDDETPIGAGAPLSNVWIGERQVIP